MKYEFKKENWTTINNTSGDVWIKTDLPVKGDIVCEAPLKSYEDSLIRWEINKHIICAAPDLLEACINMANYCNENNIEVLVPEYEQMITAIHKALNIQS